MTTKRKRRGPRKATPKHLENAALHYLGRFASSAANLKRVLMRKVQRSARFHGTDIDEGRATVERLVARFARAGLIDDEAYAAARAASLHRRGAAPKLITARLREKGVAAATIERALETLGESSGDVELAAAVNLARRRRLGPYRPETHAKGRAKADRSNRKRTASEREKALAALARAGFSYDVARRVIDADGIDELEQAAGL
ncbi:MAG: RecX family transcriptional regulator [Rhodospirillales bacterium]|nr:RecX family transcriptional regulator [Rhodospirillales bacterium]